MSFSVTFFHCPLVVLHNESSAQLPSWTLSRMLGPPSMFLPAVHRCWCGRDLPWKSLRESWVHMGRDRQEVSFKRFPCACIAIKEKWGGCMSSGSEKIVQHRLLEVNRRCFYGNFLKQFTKCVDQNQANNQIQLCKSTMLNKVRQYKVHTWSE